MGYFVSFNFNFDQKLKSINIKEILNDNKQIARLLIQNKRTELNTLINEDFSALNIGSKLSL